jgi:hypothetical protein
MRHAPYKSNFHQNLCFIYPSTYFYFFQLQQAPFSLYWGRKHKNIKKNVCMVKS